MSVGLVRAIWEWQYEEDWIAYEVKTCIELENLYRGADTECQIEVNGNIFNVNINTKTQVNTKTKKVRAIRRSVTGYVFWKWHDGKRLHRFEPYLELSLEKNFKDKLVTWFTYSSFGGAEMDLHQISMDDMELSIRSGNKMTSYKMVRISVEPYMDRDIDNLADNRSNSNHNSLTTNVSQSTMNSPLNRNQSEGQVKSNSKSSSIFLSISKFFKASQKREKWYPVTSHILKKLNISNNQLGNVISEGALEFKGIENIIEQCNDWEIFQNANSQDDDCAICLAPMTDDVIKLSKCPHHFHSSCFKMYITHSQKAGIVCPKCCFTLHKGNGPCPKGNMLWTTVSTSLLDGHSDCGTIIILYIIPKGIQSIRHLNPGTPFMGTMRAAYLPNNKEGKLVFKLFQRAFSEGHTFTVGDSITTGRTNVVTWNGIHHKTSRSGGSLFYGYPDPTYHERVLVELKEKGVEPTEEDLESIK